MGVYLTKIGNTYNIPIQTYECDNDTDKSGLDLTHLEPGTRLHVIDTDKNYVLNNSKEWKEISSGGGGGGGGASVLLGTISLSTTWSGSDPYAQVVTVTGATVTANSLVDLQLTATQIAAFMEDGVTALTAENNNGTITVYALGAEPSTAMDIQVRITEGI